MQLYHFFNLGARCSELFTPSPGRFTPATDPVPIVQEVRCVQGPVRTGVESLGSAGIFIPGRSSPQTLLRYILFKKYEQAQFFLFSYDCLSPLAPSLYTMTQRAKTAFIFLWKLCPLCTLSKIYIYIYIYIHILTLLNTFQINVKNKGPVQFLIFPKRLKISRYF